MATKPIVWVHFWY